MKSPQSVALLPLPFFFFSVRRMVRLARLRSQVTMACPMRQAKGGEVDPFDQFEAYAAIADQLIAELSKAQLAECARMLALHLADYRQRFGEIPHADLLHVADLVKIGNEQATLLRDGMEMLVSYLGNMRDAMDQGKAQ